MGVGRAFRFGKHILDTYRFQNGTYRTAGYHTRTVRCRTDKNAGAAELTFRSVRHRRTHQRNADKIFLSVFDSFDDSFGYFLRFTKAMSYHTFFVSHHYNGGKSECASAFCNFRHAVHAYQAVYEFQPAGLNPFY